MASPYFDEIFQCSFNGAPFFSRGGKSNVGRKVVVHKYPYRDTVWPEDTGRKAREFSIDGFIVGDDVIAQRDWMKIVCETPGPGILIHPTYGVLSVSLLNLEITENYQHGREIRLNFSFIESGQQLFPSLAISTFNAIANALGNTDTAAADSFITRVSDAIALGASVVVKGVQTVTTFAALGGGLVKTATNLFHLASSIPGTFGRFFGGNTGSGTGSILGSAASLGGIAAQLTSLTAAAATSRSNVAGAAASAASVAENSPTALPASIQNYTRVILAAITDPNDAVQIFSILAAFPQPANHVLAPIGEAQETLQTSVTDLARRAAISGLAQASSFYQPLSYDDAANLRARICAIIDSEITIAGDQGEDQVFLTLKQLRAAVVQDLTTRGASLAAVVQKSYNASLPALAVAYRLYEDINRTDQVIAFANPPHPAFMPLKFPALSA